MDDYGGGDELFSYRVVWQPADVAELRLTGELDLFSVVQLREVVRDIRLAMPRCLIVDLSGLTFADARGLGVLIEMVRETRSRGVTVDLLHQVPAIERLAQLLHVELDDLLGEVTG